MKLGSAIAHGLNHLYPKFVAVAGVKDEICGHFGYPAEAIIQAMMFGHDFGTKAGDVRDIVTESLAEHAVVVAEPKASG